MAARKPDFVLKAMHKVTGRKSQQLGGGWINTNGSVTIVLDWCVVVPNDPDVVLTLFPKNWKEDPLSEAIGALGSSPFAPLVQGTQT